LKGHYTKSVRGLRESRERAVESWLSDLRVRQREILSKSHMITERQEEEALLKALLEFIHRQTR